MPFAGNPPPPSKIQKSQEEEKMVLRVAVCPQNYDLIYRAIDLKSAYSIVKEYTAKMKDDEMDAKKQFLETAKAERIKGEKAIRKGDIQKADLVIQRLCNLAVQVDTR